MKFHGHPESKFDLVKTGITITREQKEFLQSHKEINLSGLVRAVIYSMIDEYGAKKGHMAI